MKRLGRLWPEVANFDNLLRAYLKARKGKQSVRAVAEFTLNLEAELISLQQELNNFSYRPGSYRLFTIYERKKRQIAAAPFRDRVVHHAVMNIIEPLIDRRFIFDSYACRQGKGVHAAVDRYQKWSKRYPYVLKMDIEQYFPSIDHDVLKVKLRHYLKDRFVLALLNTIIDTAPRTTYHVPRTTYHVPRTTYHVPRTTYGGSAIAIRHWNGEKSRIVSSQCHPTH